MTEEHVDHDANRAAVQTPDGVEHIGDIIRQLLDDRGWHDVLTPAEQRNTRTRGVTGRKAGNE
jgi:hypothetical protein